MKYLLSLLLFILPVSVACAQRNIVESLQTRHSGEGTVTIHQDAHIASLIGTRYVKSASAQGSVTGNNKVLKARGFRIQVYAGNNSRTARTEANAMGNKVKEDFPEIPVYTYFQPPRWLCRVGDFKSMEEAYATMRKLKESGNFKEVSIVREQINIPIE